MNKCLLCRYSRAHAGCVATTSTLRNAILIVLHRNSYETKKTLNANQKEQVMPQRVTILAINFSIDENTPYVNVLIFTKLQLLFYTLYTILDFISTSTLALFI